MGSCSGFSYRRMSYVLCWGCSVGLCVSMPCKLLHCAFSLCSKGTFTDSSTPTVICNFTFLLCLLSNPSLMSINGLHKRHRVEIETTVLSCLIMPYIPTPLLPILDMYSVFFLIFLFSDYLPDFFLFPETPPHPSVIIARREVVKFMTFRSSGAGWWRTRIVFRDPSGISLSLMSK